MGIAVWLQPNPNYDSQQRKYSFINFKIATKDLIAFPHVGKKCHLCNINCCVDERTGIIKQVVSITTPLSNNWYDLYGTRTFVTPVEWPELYFWRDCTTIPYYLLYSCAADGSIKIFWNFNDLLPGYMALQLREQQLYVAVFRLA
jgi:hypothetical protein